MIWTPRGRNITEPITTGGRTVAAKKRDVVDWLVLLVALGSALTGVVLWVTGTSEKESTEVRDQLLEDINKNTAAIDVLEADFFAFQLASAKIGEKFRIFFDRQTALETQVNGASTTILKLDWRISSLEGASSPAAPPPGP